MLAARLGSRLVARPTARPVMAARSLATGKGRPQPPHVGSSQGRRGSVRAPSAASRLQSRTVGVGAAGSAAARANTAQGRFLRAEEEEEDALLDEDEDFDDEFDPHALPAQIGLAQTPHDDILDGVAGEEQAAVREEELTYAEEMEKLPAETRDDDDEIDHENTIDISGLKSPAMPFKTTPELYRKIKKIVSPTAEDEEALEMQEEEEQDKQEYPEFTESSAIPEVQQQDRKAVAEAIFQGYFKEHVTDAKQRLQIEADRATYGRLRREFFAKIEGEKYTEAQMKAWAGSEFKERITQVNIPLMETIAESQARLIEMPIEQFYKSAAEAHRSGVPTLALGNKWVPPMSFVRIKQQEFEAFFPEGVAGSLDKEWLLMKNRRNILVRQPALDVCDALQKQLQSRFTAGPSAHFVTGGPGYGKSCVLSTIVYWARKNGWLVVWIPSGFNFVNDGNLQRSRREPLRFDQPEVAMPFLETFGKGNAHIIGDIKLRTSFTIGAPQAVFSSEGKTMLDLVNFGKGDFNHATDAAFYLRQELNLVDEFPVLVAIDDYNQLHSHAVNLYDPDFQKLNPPLISPEKLVLPSLFMSWKNHGLVNGTMVCAMSNTKPRNTKEFDARFPKLPAAYLVPRYNRDEFLTIVANYEQNGYIHSPTTTETYKYVYHMCAGRGREIYKMLALY